MPPPRIENSHGLAQACFYDEGVEEMLEVYDVDLADDDGMTALHWCVIANHQSAAVAKRLLRGGATVDCVDKMGFTPLMYASGRYACAAVVRELLKAGANANQPNRTGSVSLHMACLLGHHEIVHLLLDIGKADVKITNRQGQASLDLVTDDETRNVLLQYQQKQQQPDKISRDMFSSKIPKEASMFIEPREQKRERIEHTDENNGSGNDSNNNNNSPVEKKKTTKQSPKVLAKSTVAAGSGGGARGERSAASARKKQSVAGKVGILQRLVGIDKHTKKFI